MGEREESRRYEVVFSGELVDGYDSDLARNSIASTFLMNPLAAARLRIDGSTEVVYTSASKPLALEVSRRFLKAGLRCKVRRRTNRPPRQDERPPAGDSNITYICLAIIILIMAVAAIYP